MLLYRFLVSALAVKELGARALRGDWSAVKARLGRTHPPSDDSHVWLHAASNGELASAKPVIAELANGGRDILLTVNTDSALHLARGWAMPNVTPVLATLDLTGPTRRMMSRWSVTAHITLESDLWPNRILHCPGPVIVLGGRLTERSAKGWKRFAPLAQKVLSRVSYLSAQDTGSKDRFLSMGLPQKSAGPVFDLKGLYTSPEAKPDPELQQSFDRNETWLAASTHQGEDEIVLNAHKKALEKQPDLKLILAPRHPKRAGTIADLIAASGLTVARRSLSQNPRNVQVYLADTLGEMHLWYALAGITFVAGSLTDRGGHTPYEPAALNSAIIHGPDVANFRAAYERLEDANAAKEIADADSLANALIEVLSSNLKDQMAQAAQRALKQDTDFPALMHDIVTTLDA